jgi:hypothetical protein
MHLRCDQVTLLPTLGSGEQVHAASGPASWILAVKNVRTDSKLHTEWLDLVAEHQSIAKRGPAERGCCRVEGLEAPLVFAGKWASDAIPRRGSVQNLHFDTERN